MSVPVIAFLTNMGGVGKTSLVYHLAWMYAESDISVVAVDLDPQANLTSAFLEEADIERVWANPRGTVSNCIAPLLKGTGDIETPVLEELTQRLALIPGSLELTKFEDQLSEVWPKCLEGDERAFRVTTAFWRVMQSGAKERGAQMILVDLGPNLGAINRATLVASDFVVVPLAPDLYSLQGLENLGPAFRKWRRDWQERVAKSSELPFDLPSGEMLPLGYVVMQHSVRLDRPVRAYEKWIARIPETYHRAVLDEHDAPDVTVKTDPHCLSLLKHYRSLMPMAQEARKPIFFLKPADGAIGSHTRGVSGAYEDFKRLARAVAEKAGLPVVP
jgi:cellulose biosynthesis protein BcsQ